MAILGREQVLRGPDDQLFVELTRVTLTKEDALALKKGSVVELGPESKEALWLQFGGRLIGQCEPVEINGKPGARVTELL